MPDHTHVDDAGREWSVQRIGAHGFGARAGSDAHPEVSEETFRFTSGEQIRVGVAPIGLALIEAIRRAFAVSRPFT